MRSVCWKRACREHGPGTPDDGGQVLLLTIGYALIGLLLVTAVVSATGVHLERKRLLAVADQAALAGATALDEASYYGRSGGAGESGTGGGASAGGGSAGGGSRDGLVRLTEASVRAAVLAHLEASPGTARLEGLHVVDVRTDGRTAEVTLAALARPVLVSLVTAPWSDGVRLQVTASARAG